MIRLLESEQSGPFNATSPPNLHMFRSMLADCRAEEVVWVTEEFLAERGVEGWSDLPCWLPSTAEDFACFQLVPVDRAVAAGLTFRPLAETAREVPEWTGAAGLSPERERELLAAWERIAA
jgi:2'-hydroxyisoflavone reductase